MLHYTAADIIYGPLHWYATQVKAEEAAKNANLTLYNRMAMMGKTLDGEVVVMEIHEG